MSNFLCGFWELNWGHHTWVANSLLTELSPQPSESFFLSLYYVYAYVKWVHLCVFSCVWVHLCGSMYVEAWSWCQMSSVINSSFVDGGEACELNSELTHSTSLLSQLPPLSPLIFASSMQRLPSFSLRFWESDLSSSSHLHGRPFINGTIFSAPISFFSCPPSLRYHSSPIGICFSLFRGQSSVSVTERGTVTFPDSNQY